MKPASVECLKRLANARRLATQRNSVKIAELTQKLANARIDADVERARHGLKTDLLESAGDVLRAFAWGLATDETRKRAVELYHRIDRVLGREFVDE